MHCCGAVYPAPGAKPMPAAREPSASPQERLCFLLGAPRSSVALRPGWSPAFPGKQYDIARRTVWRTGLTRFIAVCLRSGYGWLSVGGVLTWRFASVLAGPYYDAMLHAIFVGFVVTMIFGHAPIILPAILGRTTSPYPGKVGLHGGYASESTGHRLRYSWDDVAGSVHQRIARARREREVYS